MKYSDYTNNSTITNNSCYILQKGLNTMSVLHSSIVNIIKNKYLPIHQDINTQISNLLPSIKCYTNTFNVNSGTSINDKINLTDNVEITFNHLSSLSSYTSTIYNITIMTNISGGYATYKINITFDNKGNILYFENYGVSEVGCGFQYKFDFPPGSGNIMNKIILTGIKNISPSQNGDYKLILTKTVDTLTRFNLKFIIGPTLSNGTYTFYTRVEKI